MLLWRRELALEDNKPQTLATFTEFCVGVEECFYRAEGVLEALLAMSRREGLLALQRLLKQDIKAVRKQSALLNQVLEGAESAKERAKCLTTDFPRAVAEVIGRLTLRRDSQVVE